MPSLTDEHKEPASLNPPPRASYSPTTSFFTRVLGTRRAPAHRVSESLDYEPLQNKLYVHQLHERRDGRKKIYGYTGHTLAKFVVTFATGIATGALASCLTYCVSFLHDWKQEIVQGTLDGPPSNSTGIPGDSESDDTSNIFMAVIKFWVFGGVLVVVATALVQYWAPAASGAGVTLVMAYLNGNHIPHLLRPSTLVAKFVGTVASVASGLPMGPEGPMVHIGACVASAISYVDCKLVRNGKLRSIFGQFRLKRERNSGDSFKVLDDIVSDTDHREFISAGVSAGIAAAFGAPIGGVLYSMEEACSFWSRKVAWRCFIAGTLSTFTIQIMTAGAAHGAIAYSNLVRMEVKDWLMQLPFLLVNFVMAGLLGAAFNSMRMWLWKIRASKTMHIQRILEVVGLLVLVGVCGFFFAWAAGTCIDLPEDWWKDEQVGGVREYGVRFLCGDQQHNDVATLFLSSTHHTIVRLFSMGRLSSVDPSSAGITSSFSPGALALYTLVYLGLMSLGAGLAIPGGLFMPSIVVGASWGAMWGILVQNWMPLHWNVQPGLYALLAATGVLGGVFRSVISLVVLMVEGTQGIEFLPGIILAVVVANWVAHYIHHDGVYESELERTGNVYMLRDEPPHRLHTLTTQDIMATGVVGFKSIENVSRVLEVLSSTTHNGFPVFVQEEEDLLQDFRQAALASPTQGASGAGLQMGSAPWGQHGAALKQQHHHQQQQQEQQVHQQQYGSAQAHPGGVQHLLAHAGGTQGVPAWSHTPSSPYTPVRQPHPPVPLPHSDNDGGDLGGVDGLSGAGIHGGVPGGVNGSRNEGAQWRANGSMGGVMGSNLGGGMSGVRGSAVGGARGGMVVPGERHTTATQTPTAMHALQGLHGALLPGAVPKRTTMRLEGFVLRCQLLVLLQRRHFCDAHGNPVGRDQCDKYDLELEAEMRTFFRRYYTHSRYLSATPAALDKLALRGTNMQEHASGLYLDLRPFMNRAPFTIRTDCSAARAHQVFMGIGLRHLLVVDSAGHVVGIITRKDLDHAAGHGWWRVSAVAGPPQNSGSRTTNRWGCAANAFSLAAEKEEGGREKEVRFWSGVGFLRSLMGSTPGKTPNQQQQQQQQQHHAGHQPHVQQQHEQPQMQHEEGGLVHPPVCQSDLSEQGEDVEQPGMPQETQQLLQSPPSHHPQ